jgi:hypothetical protein
MTASRQSNKTHVNYTFILVRIVLACTSAPSHDLFIPQLGGSIDACVELIGRCVWR